VIRFHYEKRDLYYALAPCVSDDGDRSHHLRERVKVDDGDIVIRRAGDEGACTAANTTAIITTNRKAIGMASQLCGRKPDSSPTRQPKAISRSGQLRSYSLVPGFRFQLGKAMAEERARD
jgi:hypothetical protein